MSRLVTIYKVKRIPDTARARHVGATYFEVVASSETDAIAKAKGQSAWDVSAFAWYTDGCRVVTIEEGGR